MSKAKSFEEWFVTSTYQEFVRRERVPLPEGSARHDSVLRARGGFCTVAAVPSLDTLVESRRQMCQRVLPLLIGLLLTYQSAFALEDFTMGISTMHISIAYLYIGKERGFFADEGIELKLIHIPAYLARTALIARQLDGMEFGSTSITLRANGAPVANIFSQSEKPGWFLLTNPGIKELKQLAGKAITVGVLGSGSHLATLEILKKAGLNPDLVVFLGGRGGSDIRLQMLAGGTVQAANLVPPSLPSGR